MSGLTTRTTTVVLLQGDDLDPIAELQAAVESAAISNVGAPQRLNDDSLQSAAQAYDAYMDEAEKRGVHVELKALGRHLFRTVVAKHPAREGDEDDKAWGFNAETIGDDLVPECFVSATSPTKANTPDVSTAAKVAEFLDGLSDGDWSRLVSAAINLNQSAGPNPKARISSRLAPTSGATGTSPSA
jgi:hypothetical protein